MKSRFSFNEMEVIFDRLLHVRVKEVTEPGIYFFVDDDSKKWIVRIDAPGSQGHIVNDGYVRKIEFGKTEAFHVESLGYGEFIGPIKINAL